MKIRMVKVKAGQQKLRERIKDALAKKGARASILINKLAANKKAVIWKPAELDAIALELRHLAFQIRVLKTAKTATRRRAFRRRCSRCRPRWARAFSCRRRLTAR